MNAVGHWARGLGVALCLGASWGALADGGAPASCEREASAAHSDTARHFLVLAGSKGVFYDQSGPSFVMVIRADAARNEAEMGAVGVYADAKRRAVFGTVPWQVYDAFLREPEKGSQHVMLRLEMNEPQYERVLGILRTWERRARENELLYPEHLFMNNILLVKEATEELNRCRQSVNLYKLDWSLDDRISDENAASEVPFLVFEELKRRNESLHVADSKMPAELLRLAGSEPLSASAREPAPKQEPAAPAPAHTHTHVHH